MTNKKVLLVDDEEDLLEIIQERLELQGFSDILTASTGMAAIGILAETEVDLIISDVRMPLINGLELLDQVKVMRPSVPVILVTGFADITDIEALGRGAFDLLEKPVCFDQLFSTVNAALLNIEQRVEKVQVDPAGHQVLLASGLRDKVEWGRRGFFVPMASAWPKIDLEEPVFFEIDLGDLHASGLGTVRWERNEEGADNNGFGIIVEKLSEECYEAIVAEMSRAPETTILPV